MPEKPDDGPQDDGARFSQPGEAELVSHLPEVDNQNQPWTVESYRTVQELIDQDLAYLRYDRANAELDSLARSMGINRQTLPLANRLEEYITRGWDEINGDHDIEEDLFSTANDLWGQGQMKEASYLTCAAIALNDAGDAYSQLWTAGPGESKSAVAKTLDNLDPAVREYVTATMMRHAKELEAAKKYNLIHEKLYALRNKERRQSKSEPMTEDEAIAVAIAEVEVAQREKAKRKLPKQ